MLATVWLIQYKHNMHIKATVASQELMQQRQNCHIASQEAMSSEIVRVINV